VEELFHAALALPTAEREAFVCAQSADRAVQQDVLSLLAHADVDTGRGARADGSALEQAYAGDDELPPGTEVGGFRILALLGRGGMGVVYRAQRHAADGAAPVALKLLHRGRDDAMAMARFAREGRALARLAHPGIAAFIAAGVDPVHGPFVVMEAVSGLPLSAHCDQRALDVRARLELFCEVCEAVQAAHDCGVVHRDLKPSNVLVTPEGRPKLVDFGVAKLLPGTHDRRAPTTTWQPAPLTPAYASPEQFCGQATGPAADVFALGVLLGELLCGTPYLGARERRARPSDSVAHTPEGRRVAQARGCTPARLRRLLRGDLDAIVQAATQLQPHARPTSAAALAAEVRRHLAGRRPLVARAAGQASYACAAALAAALVLVSVAWGVGRYRQRAAPHATVDQLEPLLTASDARLAAAGGTLEQRVQPLHAVARQLEHLFDDGAPRSVQVLRALAFSHERVASLEGHTRRENLGRPGLARDHYRRAVMTRAWVLERDGSPRAVREWVDALVAYGTLTLDAFHDLPRSRAALEAAVRMAQEASTRERSADMALSLTRARVRLADLEQRSGRRAAARAQLEAVTTDMTRGLDEPASQALRLKLSGALARRGGLEATWGHPAAALGWLQAHDEQMRALGEELGVRWYRLQLADVLGNPEGPNLGRAAEAAAVYGTALAYCNAADRDDTRDAQLRRYCQEARLRDAQARAPGAPRAALRVALKLEHEWNARATAGERVNLAAAQALAARCLAALGQSAAARQRWRRASALLADLVSAPDDSLVLEPLASVLEQLGAHEARIRQRAAARDALEAARRVAERLWHLDATPASGLRLARVHWRLARLERHALAPGARAHLAAARATLRAQPGPCSGSVQRAREALHRRLVRWPGQSS
jgi:hypothetical protein